MWTSEHRLLSFDGTPLFFRRLKPKKEPRAVVFIIHGMGEHGGRYLALAEHLAGHGLESIAMDLRSFGKSGGSSKAYVDDFSDFHKDLWAVHSFVEKSLKNLPQFFLGHSFGGLIGSSYVARRRVAAKGLVLTSPIFGTALRVPRWRHCLAITASYIFPHYSESTRVDPGTLTHDPAVMAAYKKDTLIYQRISARLYRELSNMMAERRSIAEHILCPTLVLQAGEDRVVDKQMTQIFFKELASTDKEIQIYPGLYHEILNEINRFEIFTRIGEWVETKLSI